MSDVVTIARPYAEAVFARALETDSVDQWADALELISVIAENESIADLMSNPSVSHERKEQLLLEIVAERVDTEANNLLRLLVENNRLLAAPEIAALFQQMKNERAGSMDVDVTSAYVLKPAQKKELAAALKKTFGREVNINSTKDPALIGGIVIRAGDMVIDGSIAGQLSRLANELGI